MNLERHEFLEAYLQYTHNTESPRLLHIWAALSAVSACLGRRCWFESGRPIWPNMYVVFSGLPGGRKSSAIDNVTELLKKVTSIRFSPDDTGGQRQGLIKAMTTVGEGKDDKEEYEQMLRDLERAQNPETFAEMNGHTSHVVDKLKKVKFDIRDPHSMYIASGELKSFIGENNSQMLTFLLRMWDGGSYKYELRNTEYEIEDGLLGILGATTPSELALMIPPSAMGSGFTSRIIFVYAGQRTRNIPRWSLDRSVEPFLLRVFEELFANVNGGFRETPEAAAAYDDIYMRGITIKDPRFLSYIERRHTHLQKASLALAASRGSTTVGVEDIYLADQLLMVTEETMPEALGEYGMNKASIAKQKLVEFINSIEVPIPIPALYSMMSRDMTQIDFRNTITELTNGRKATVLVVKELGQCIIGVSDTQARRAKKEMDDVKRLLGARRTG
jgi:Protein of unknown function (DUF3987)